MFGSNSKAKAKAIAVEIIWVCCCCVAVAAATTVAGAVLVVGLFRVFRPSFIRLHFVFYLFIFFCSAPSDWESLKSGPEQCECVHVLNFLFRFMPFSFVPLSLSLLPVLILYERCFSYSTSMVFFLFFLVIFFIAFSVSLARVGRCCVVFFARSLFSVARIFIYFFSSSALNFVWFSSASVCVYPLLLLLLLSVVVVMLLYRLFYFVFFFSYFFSVRGLSCRICEWFYSHLFFTIFFYFSCRRRCVLRFFSALSLHVSQCDVCMFSFHFISLTPSQCSASLFSCPLFWFVHRTQITVRAFWVSCFENCVSRMNAVGMVVCPFLLIQSRVQNFKWLLGIIYVFLILFCFFCVLISSSWKPNDDVIWIRVKPSDTKQAPRHSSLFCFNSVENEIENENKNRNKKWKETRTIKEWKIT